MSPRVPQLPTLSVVIPAHNEAENLLPLTEEIVSVLRSYFEGDGEFELLIVNDGSTDETVMLEGPLVEEFPMVRMVHHRRNLGYGAALRSGFRAARGAYVGFIDGDRQLDPADFIALLEAAGPGRIAMGYRVARQDPFHRRVLGKLFSRVFVPLILGVNVRDVDCALKIIPRSLLSRIELRATGALINAELLAIAAASGCHFIQLPVSHRPRVSGEQSGARFSVMAKVFLELTKVRRQVHEYRAASDETMCCSPSVSVERV
ncbi:MAG: glycosyltransferase family 2 protein [Bdellovibrionales bacterium]|nr:glycosyltransferase family 2 protein [Bdellovibrionales bacterium]